jgi:hypothetical protein
VARGTGPSASANNQKKTKWDKAAIVIQGIAAFAIPISLIALLIGVGQFKAQQATSAGQALDQQRQTTLDNYLDAMSSLVLNYHLSTSRSGSPVNALAVARTDTAVRNLDGARKGILIRYLWEANLINQPRPVINLFEVDLSGAVFAHANLYHADMSMDNLVDAHFNDANPYGADLSGSNLHGAVLSGANLSCFQNSRLDISAGIAELANNKSILCANLAYADLSGANLGGADLIGADLMGADLNGADLEGAKYNSKPINAHDAFGNTQVVQPTEWPQGFDPTAAGATCVDC